MERYQEEIIRVLDGESKFTEAMLAGAINKTEDDLNKARQELQQFITENRDADTVRKIKGYYTEFLGWANEFDAATLPQKRTILRQLIDKIELGRGYKITIHFNMSYAQFLNTGVVVDATPEKLAG